MSNDILNLLPRYNPWPARLLGLEDWSLRKKVPSELIREFENEKWGPLWQTVSASPHRLLISDIDAAGGDSNKELMCWVDDHLQLMTVKEADALQLELIASTLQSLAPRTHFVELGAGYGHIAVNLALQPGMEDVEFIAGEYTESGVKLIDYLAKSHNKNITAVRCDLSTPQIIDTAVPPGAVLYTSYAAHYIPHYGLDFVANMLALKPSFVVHFEPFYEHCNPESLLGLLQKRYIEVNDYNRNLQSLLLEEQEAGIIEVVTEKKQVFGMNALLPMSILIWKPAQQVSTQ